MRSVPVALVRLGCCDRHLLSPPKEEKACKKSKAKSVFTLGQPISASAKCSWAFL